MSDVTIEIRSLSVLGDGANLTDGQHLARTTEAALQELFERQGAPPRLTSGGDVAEIIAPDINYSLCVSVEQTGRELALAIYRALGGMR